MTIDVYTATGTKKGTATLPKMLFEAPINEGLMHQALVRQQSNRRNTVAHTKSRGEVQGSTRKLYAQKGTGRARRGSIRSPLLRGGNKAFGPKKNANYNKDMPKKMRRAALFSCLSAQAKNGAILGLEGYPETDLKTKQMDELLKKLPVELGRKILIVLPEKHAGLTLSTRNIPNVETVIVNYLNPEGVLGSKHIVFMVDALKKVEEIFTTSPNADNAASPSAKATGDKKEANAASPKKKTTPKKSTTSKTTK